MSVDTLCATGNSCTLFMHSRIAGAELKSTLHAKTHAHTNNPNRIACAEHTERGRVRVMFALISTNRIWSIRFRPAADVAVAVLPHRAQSLPPSKHSTHTHHGHKYNAIVWTYTSICCYRIRGSSIRTEHKRALCHRNAFNCAH